MTAAAEEVNAAAASHTGGGDGEKSNINGKKGAGRGGGDSDKEEGGAGRVRAVGFRRAGELSESLRALLALSDIWRALRR